MRFQPFVGIDFGTCNSSMAWFNSKTGHVEILLNAAGSVIAAAHRCGVW